MVGEMWVSWILYSNHNLESDSPRREIDMDGVPMLLFYSATITLPTRRRGGVSGTDDDPFHPLEETMNKQQQQQILL